MPELPDYLQKHLHIIFVGYNPGAKAAAVGHHYAGRGNHFWRLLFDAGFTPQLLLPEQDSELLSLGYGLTNIVARSSPSSADLSTIELREGANALREKIRLCQPKIVCLLGKEVYRHYAGLKSSSDIRFGAMQKETVAGVAEFLAPNPSARSTIAYSSKLLYFHELKEILDQKLYAR